MPVYGSGINQTPKKHLRYHHQYPLYDATGSFRAVRHLRIHRPPGDLGAVAQPSDAVAYGEKMDRLIRAAHRVGKVHLFRTERRKAVGDKIILIVLPFPDKRGAGTEKRRRLHKILRDRKVYLNLCNYSVK